MCGRGTPLKPAIPAIPAIPSSVVKPEREREREREKGAKGGAGNIQSRQAQPLKSTALVDRMCSLL